ncbi:MAG: Alpha/beta hydrolase fold-3 domain protein [Mycobacterium sp.]|nr:Alpha/beta hydrolase fold-3 domain protein [Mycobacterium sp.]
MPFSLDPEIAQILSPVLAFMRETPGAPAGDVAARRELFDNSPGVLDGGKSFPDGVSCTDFIARAPDGTAVPLRWYTTGQPADSAVVYLHGGGMIMGSVDVYHGTVARYVADTGVAMLSVDYRKAPEHAGTGPAEDCYAGLVWLAEHAAELGVDLSRIAVMGDSGGGGLAAAVALLARDRGGPALARQILIYPMLDDRNCEPDPMLVPTAMWTYDDNITGWGALLGDARGSDAVSPYAAPSRVAELAGLAPAYVEVGELDIFRDECLSYAARLLAAGVSTELHVHTGLPHGYDIYAADSAVSQRARADRLRVLRAL